jgi:hypothetical protein
MVENRRHRRPIASEARFGAEGAVAFAMQLVRRMRWVLAGMILTPTALASAEPVTEPPAAHPELAVRAGIHSTTSSSGDEAPGGIGLLVETGAAWRFNSWLSLGAFAAFSRLHDSVDDPFVPNKSHAETVLFFDLGMQFSVHWSGVFVGLGMGIEERHDSVSWSHGPIGELHVGFRFPAVSWLRSAPEVVGTLGRSVRDYGGYVEIARFAIGLVF